MSSKTVAQAIKQSVSQTEIVHLDASSERESDLRVECEDHVQSGDVHEFWGTTEDGDEWRVHLHYESAEQAAADYSEVAS